MMMAKITLKERKTTIEHVTNQAPRNQPKGRIESRLKTLYSLAQEIYVILNWQPSWVGG